MDDKQRKIELPKREPRTVVEAWEQGESGWGAWLLMIGLPVGIIALLKLLWWLDDNVSWW